MMMTLQPGTLHLLRCCPYSIPADPRHQGRAGRGLWVQGDRRHAGN